MVDFTKIKQVAQDCSAQELGAALVCQQRFQTFDGPAIIQDLQQHSHLWSSFYFALASEGAAQDEWGLEGVIEPLLALATERATPETRGTRCAPYPANTLYVLAAKQDDTVAALLALGERWQADEVRLHDATDHTATCPCGVYLKRALRDAALDAHGEDWQDAVIIAYWWRHDTWLHQFASHTKLTAGVGFAANARHQGSGQRVLRGGGHQHALQASTRDQRR